MNQSPANGPTNDGPESSATPSPRVQPLTVSELLVCMTMFGVSYAMATHGHRSGHAFYINDDSQAFLVIAGAVAGLHAVGLAIASGFSVNNTIIGSMLGTVIWAWTLAAAVMYIPTHDQIYVIAPLAALVSGPAIAIRCRLSYGRVCVTQILIGGIVFIAFSLMERVTFRE